MNIDERLEKFAMAVMNEVENEYRASEEKIQAVRDEEMKKAQAESEAECRSFLAKAKSKLDHDCEMKVSEAQMELRSQLYKAREEKCNEIFSTLYSKLEKFVLSDEYTAYLNENVKKCIESINSSDTVIGVKQEDIEKLDTGASKQVKTRIKLGGFTAYSSEKGIYIDETLDGKFKKTTDDFIDKYGISLEG